MKLIYPMLDGIRFETCGHVSAGSKTHAELERQSSNGAYPVWSSPKGEKFQTKPVEVDNVIYAKAMSLTVYAISPSTGDFIGFVGLEASENIQPMYELLSGVYAVDDGILFNTRNSIVLYESG